jgi:4,5-dihydroxyphthalate decarboxylase
MHLLVLRREIFERDPSLAQALYDAFSAAKETSLSRLYDIDALSVMVPWLVPEMEASFAALGRDPWPYGYGANRSDFDVFLRYLEKQELLASPLFPEELFAPELLHT